MSYSIIPTPTFQKDVKNLKKKYRHIVTDLEELNDILTDNPLYGDAIPGLDGKVFKLRLASSDMGKGKSGSFRAIYYFLAPDKTIIFTESRRTQSYLIRLLEENGYADKIVLFNGANNDPQSRGIYNEWLTANINTDRISGSKSADMRAALVDYFKDRAKIMIATEAGAEGINLQFCSMVVNFDLPWNPQRIEQRIGRCHRYGQKHDVVVINFINGRNTMKRQR